MVQGWSLVFMLIALAAILILILVRMMYTRAPVQANYSKYWWDQSLLADFTWFAMFELILAVCSSSRHETNNMFVRMFAGFVSLIFLYEFIVPVLFPVSTISVPKTIVFAD